MKKTIFMIPLCIVILLMTGCVDDQSTQDESEELTEGYKNIADFDDKKMNDFILDDEITLEYHDSENMDGAPRVKCAIA